MELSSITLQGFRRFRNPTTLKTNGKLVALVGPNEAGKSSLLQGIVALGHDNALPESDISRGMKSSDLEIVGRFFLGPQDLEIAGLIEPCWLDMTKRSNGPRSYSIRPHSPQRDLEKRAKLLATIVMSLERKHISDPLTEDDPGFESSLHDMLATLKSGKETLAESEIDRIHAFALKIPPLAKPRDTAAIRKLDSLLNDWVTTEKEMHPRDFAIAALMARLPSIIVFDEEDRDLKSEYNVNDLIALTPVALENLASIASLDLKRLIESHQKGIQADISTIEYAANSILSTKFEESWKQSGIHVSIRVHGDALVVQVVNENHEFTSFAERRASIPFAYVNLAFSLC